MAARGKICLETPLRAKQTSRGAEEHQNRDANPARNTREPCYTPSFMPNESFFEVPYRDLCISLGFS